MNGSSKIIDITPDPVGLIKAMGSSGYKYDKIASEFIDNSIDAEATMIKVMVAGDLGPRNHVTFCDNGTGILPRDRDQVLRPGTRTTKKMLSAFGMGMKTAAFAMGRVLRILTKTSTEKTPTVIKFDYNEIIKSGRWEARIGLANGPEAAFFREYAGTHGTIVTVSDLYLGKNDLKEFEREVKKHIGLTYGLIMLGLSERYTVRPTITVNGQPVEGIDPLFRQDIKLPKKSKGEPVTMLFDTDEIQIPFEVRNKAKAMMTIVNLPHPSVLEAEDPVRSDRYKMFGAVSLRKTCGFYIYREDRLIQFGVSLGYTEGSHIDTMRGEIRFFKDADQIVMGNYTKSSLKWNDMAKEHLDGMISIYCKTARDAYERVNVTRLAPSEEAQKMADAVSKVIDSRLAKHKPLPPVGKHSKKFDRHFGKRAKKRDGKFGLLVYTKPTKSDIRIVKTLPGFALFEGFIENTRVGVRIAEDHPYFKMFKNIEKKSPDAWAHFLFSMHAIVSAQMISGDGFEEVHDRVNSEVSSLLRKYAEKWSR